MSIEIENKIIDLLLDNKEVRVKDFDVTKEEFAEILVSMQERNIIVGVNIVRGGTSAPNTKSPILFIAHNTMRVMNIPDTYKK